MAGLGHLPPILIEHVVQKGSWSWPQTVICEVEVEDAIAWHACSKKALYELELVECLVRPAHSRDDMDQIEGSRLRQARDDVLAWSHFMEGDSSDSRMSAP